MEHSETLSVRLDSQTRRVLAEAAATHGFSGASALARDILERWAADTLAAQRRASIDRAADYLRTHAEGWSDDPVNFFSGATTGEWRLGKK